jgi:hypothetical protein
MCLAAMAVSIRRTSDMPLCQVDNAMFDSREEFSLPSCDQQVFQCRRYWACDDVPGDGENEATFFLPLQNDIACVGLESKGIPAKSSVPGPRKPRSASEPHGGTSRRPR